MLSQNLRHHALLMLDRKGDILESAREVSQVLTRAGVDAAIVGGVAVLLHGHIRTTIDVDVYVGKAAKKAASALEAAGFTFDRPNRPFLKSGVPIHLVLLDQITNPPTRIEEIDAIRTVSLADLINIKLRSGLADPLRAQDLADVIGLIRARNLTATFAAQLDKPLRPDFRKLARAIAREAKPRRSGPRPPLSGEEPEKPDP